MLPETPRNSCCCRTSPGPLIALFRVPTNVAERSRGTAVVNRHPAAATAAEDQAAEQRLAGTHASPRPCAADRSDGSRSRPLSSFGTKNWNRESRPACFPVFWVSTISLGDLAALSSVPNRISAKAIRLNAEKPLFWRQTLQPVRVYLIWHLARFGAYSSFPFQSYSRAYTSRCTRWAKPLGR
jgi:hypothetical protein